MLTLLFNPIGRVETSPPGVLILGPHGFTVTSCFIMPPPPILLIALDDGRCCGTAFFGIMVIAELFLKGRTLLTFVAFIVRLIGAGMLPSVK